SGSATATGSGGTGALSYSWSPGGATTATANNLGAGAYTCTVTDANGCTKNTTVTVNSSGGPTVAVGSQTDPLCHGGSNGSAAVTASGGTAPYTYSWSPAGGSAATATGLSAGTYTCTVTDAGGCVHTQTVFITQPVQITDSTAFTNASCGSSNGTALVNADGGTGTLTYSWSPTGGIGPNASGLSAGTYTCTVSDANGCTLTATLNIITDSIPVAHAGTNTTISSGSSVTLQGSGGGTYSWTPASGLSCVTCPNPVASPASTTEYCLHISNGHGCTDSSCVLITVDEPCGQIYVPNFFSPNADGENDRLCIYGNCIQSLQFAIYDRWGERVFETNDVSLCWDGHFRGEKMNSAVFAYYAKVVLLNGQKVSLKGNITLIR
ncbi:MAG: gliding motility-associated C-terminal domain-containing protein, partial [Bacteroidia bacterium]